MLYLTMILFKVDISVIKILIGATTRGMKWFVDFIAGKIQLLSFDQSYNLVVIDQKISQILMKSHPIMPNLLFSFKLRW